MQNMTETGVNKPGIFSRLWNSKQTENSGALTVSSAGQKLPVPTGNSAKQIETVPKTSGPKLLKGPGLGSLMLVLMGDRKLCIGEIAEELGLSMVAASRLVSQAEKEGFVVKQRKGRFVYVTAVPKEQREERRRKK